MEDNLFLYVNKLTVYISLSVADAKTVLTRSTASASDSGVTASCNKSYFNVEALIKHDLKHRIFHTQHRFKNFTWAGKRSGLGDFNWLSRKGIMRVDPEP
jgi:hypothetical protein